MELTWIAILASLSMALAAVCILIFAVKKDYFHNIGDTKYLVFWSDLEDLDSSKEKSNAKRNGSSKRWGARAAQLCGAGTLACRVGTHADA